jgi:hypothetical protein
VPGTNFHQSFAQNPKPCGIVLSLNKRSIKRIIVVVYIFRFLQCKYYRIVWIIKFNDGLIGVTVRCYLESRTLKTDSPATGNMSINPNDPVGTITLIFIISTIATINYH